jgi:hypothetical protein
VLPLGIVTAHDGEDVSLAVGDIIAKRDADSDDTPLAGSSVTADPICVMSIEDTVASNAKSWNGGFINTDHVSLPEQAALSTCQANCGNRGT